MLPGIAKSLKSSTIGRAASALSKSDQKKIIAVVILQIGLGVLDLVGVALIGVLGALAVNGIDSKAPGNRVSALLNLLHLSHFSFQAQAGFLGVAATLILVLRTALSISFMRRAYFFLSRRSAAISSDLIAKLLSQSLLEIQSRTTQETLYSLTTGVNTVTLGILGAAISLVSDASLILVMFIGLIVVNITIALSSILIFGCIGIAVYKFMHIKAKDLGTREAKLSVESNEKLVEVLQSYRELVVRNRRSYYANETSKIRLLLSNTLAELTFLPNVSKYVIESSVILGALAISAIQFITLNAVHAVATLSVFLAASTRIAPAILRVQQGAVQIRSSLGSATPTLDLIDKLKSVPSPELTDSPLVLEHSDFFGEVEFKNASFAYPGSNKAALKNITLTIRQGEFVAIVGPSGAGKTTLVDVLLGILRPAQGEVLISNQDPVAAIGRWPGAIGYVPQDVIISKGTIKQNVALGFDSLEIPDEVVLQALQIAQLAEFSQSLPDGIHSQVGEAGSRISGGQRQRLGLARALFTNPKLIVLDEATSALDGQTEQAVATALDALRGKVTLITIAHRLATIKNADKVIYMDNGEVISVGTFSEVRSIIANFDNQANSLGL